MVGNPTLYRPVSRCNGYGVRIDRHLAIGQTWNLTKDASTGLVQDNGSEEYGIGVKW